MPVQSDIFNRMIREGTTYGDFARRYNDAFLNQIPDQFQIIDPRYRGYPPPEGLDPQDAPIPPPMPSKTEESKKEEGPQGPMYGPENKPAGYGEGGEDGTNLLPWALGAAAAGLGAYGAHRYLKNRVPPSVPNFQRGVRFPGTAPAQIPGYEKLQLGPAGGNMLGAGVPPPPPRFGDPAANRASDMLGGTPPPPPPVGARVPAPVMDAEIMPFRKGDMEDMAEGVRARESHPSQLGRGQSPLEGRGSDRDMTQGPFEMGSRAKDSPFGKLDGSRGPLRERGGKGMPPEGIPPPPFARDVPFPQLPQKGDDFLNYQTMGDPFSPGPLTTPFTPRKKLGTGSVKGKWSRKKKPSKSAERRSKDKKKGRKKDD